MEFLTDTNPSTEIPDDQLIQNGKTPYPFWVWLFALAVIILLILGVQGWHQRQIKGLQKDNPFFNVTNRQFSLFLWENPRFMRANVSSKHAYLPGFKYLDSVVPEENMADQVVYAPPKLLFEYHTWDRLLADDPMLRSIPKQEFLTFLEQDAEWKPCCWPAQPKGYAAFIEGLPKSELTDLKGVSFEVLPNDVRSAFIGWKNYYLEGPTINALKPTYKDLERFMVKYSEYSRNFWRNLMQSTVPDYLLDYSKKQFKPEDEVPKEQISPILRLALYNFLKAESEAMSAKEVQKPS